ncbi:TPA: hypothetical protein ACN7T1_001114 [Klebsiella pneumoniae]|nr:hypothetical protein [Klebsiella pneumoniae]MCF0413098.1 hypothetical protein [Klebsiella pneumoniae]HBR1941970.1 hypothetical protein [Klebsiella pneumoniae]HCI5883867.1 hypothetical protein [Klebsiella pneumoniae]
MTIKLSRERLQEIAEDGFLKHGESKELARMALAAMDSEPVAEVVSIYGDPEAFGEREIRPLVGIQQMPYGTKLYRHAQPVPELKPVGYLFISDQGAIVYSPTDWGMPGFRLVGQIYGDIDVEAQPAPEKYNIGDATMRHIFTPTGMTNVSDMQAVFDRVEAVLVGMDQPAPVVPEEKQIPNTLSMYAVDAVAAIA